MKKNRLVAWMGILVISFILIGCGKKKDVSDNSYEEIKKQGVIKIGTEGTYSPYSYHNEKDKLVGYDVDVARAVAKKLGIKAEFVESPWDSMLSAFDAGKSDVVFNQVGITKERKVKYDYTKPYTVSHSVLIVKKENQDIKDFEDLKGKTSAQTLTSNYGTLAEKYGATLVGTDGFSKSIELVIEGRADATLNDDVTFLDYKKQKPDAPIKIVAESSEETKTAAIVKKGDKDLVKAIDQALIDLKSEGKLKEISKKYFGKDISE
ncbi:MAG: amino acid ABC transporter substrate-binding protein [Streptococcaceae bacterium]|nr:amino acid ABC transporter substrate-binding protein [Streptococcaceae bacterium]